MYIVQSVIVKKFILCCVLYFNHHLSDLRFAALEIK